MLVFRINDTDTPWIWFQKLKRFPVSSPWDCASSCGILSLNIGKSILISSSGTNKCQYGMKIENKIYLPRILFFLIVHSNYRLTNIIDTSRNQTAVVHILALTTVRWPDPLQFSHFCHLPFPVCCHVTSDSFIERENQQLRVSVFKMFPKVETTRRKPSETCRYFFSTTRAGKFYPKYSLSFPQTISDLRDS